MQTPSLSSGNGAGNPPRSIGVVLSALIGCAACHSEPAPRDPGTEAARPASLSCPSLEDSLQPGFDLASAFGIERTFSARVERMLRLTRELETSARQLAEQTSSVCSALAGAFSPAPLRPEPHACQQALERLRAVEQRLGDAGLSITVGGLRCGIDSSGLEACAGECLTGRSGVSSRVACASAEARAGAGAGAGCSFDFELPHASPECAARCAVRALREARCSADVDVSLAGSALDGAVRLDVLREELPRLAALGGAFSTHALETVAEVRALVDELAGSIDSLRSDANPKSARLLGAAVLAGCVGPHLASTVRAGAGLEASLEGVARLEAALLTSFSRRPPTSWTNEAADQESRDPGATTE